MGYDAERARVRLILSGDPNDFPLPPFERTTPAGYSMSFTLERRDGDWWLDAAFEPHQWEEALEQFVTVVEEICVLLTISLDAAVMRHHDAVVELPDGQAFGLADLWVHLGTPSPTLEDPEAAASLLETAPRVSSLARDIANRYRRCLEDPSRLLADSYYCLTRLEDEAGGRNPACAAFGLSRDVLSKIGEITSVSGGVHNARKSPAREHSSAENRWLWAAMRTIAERLALGQILPILKMSDLPPLT
jgi:hypothetical protein